MKTMTIRGIPTFQAWIAKLVLVAMCCGMPLLAVSGQEEFDDETCAMCHADQEMLAEHERGDALFIDPEVFAKSTHGELGCVTCHYDIEELPHPEELDQPMCQACHEEGEIYDASMHGIALAEGDPLAPNCWDCHGAHDILNSSDPNSRTNPVHIPTTCGSCHAENAPVAKERNIDQHDILQHYAESIHGEGLRRKGLTVTAECSSCHTAHNVRPHTDPESSIHRENVVATCLQCHALIEQVHTKVIEGELWEKDPAVIPICIDCHQPHEVRTVFYDDGVSDKECMSCHMDPVQGADKTIPAVDLNSLIASTHTGVRCAQCHTGASVHTERACETIAESVDCSICHAEQVEQHEASIHGMLAAEGVEEAPVCLDCHSGHATLSKTNPESPTFPNNVPGLCGSCHRDGEVAARRMAEHGRDIPHITEDYSMSIHGKGLLDSGLLVTATCTACHTAHQPLPSDDPRSTVHRDNIAHTCGACHQGIEQTFQQSIHASKNSTPEEPMPVCSGCHSAHSIKRVDEAGFKLDVEQTCGRCHEDVMETYFDTYHGKVSRLGAALSAKCHDCHGAHDVLPIDNPESKLSRENIVQTCAECHPGSNRQFAGYLTHATHHDPKKYPALFITFWAMTALLVGTFAFFGIHTLAWIPLSFQELKIHLKQVKEDRAAHRKMFRRFDPIVRQMHFVLILSFFGLALTGMALKFSYMPWAQFISQVLGGFHTMGTIHRVCATVMVIVFVIHLGVIVHRKRKSGSSWKTMLTGPNTLVPNMRDLREFFETVKWFRGKGPRPNYGKWTYWEKFDYFAVFWGVAIIGSTGFILWFPELCTRVLPGWFINVATIIHSDEALLATGFIFTIHFFNTHFRPEKFPMDLAMFTGRVSVEELKREKPDYYKQLEESGELEKHLIDEAPKEFRFWAIIFGTLALVVGFSLVIFIVWSMVFGYQ